MNEKAMNSSFEEFKDWRLIRSAVARNGCAFLTMWDGSVLITKIGEIQPVKEEFEEWDDFAQEDCPDELIFVDDGFGAYGSAEHQLFGDAWLYQDVGEF